MNAKMMSEILKEMEEIRMENKKTLEELSDNLKIEKEKPLDNKACWQCILFYMKPSKRMRLGHTYPTLRSLEKSVPLKLRFLEITKNAISVDYHHRLKFSKNKNKCHGVDSLFPISVFVGNDASRNTEDAVRNAVFVMFAGRSNFQVGHYWSEVIIPFELNIHAKSVHISSKEGKHAKNIFKTIYSTDYVMIKDFESITDINYTFVQKSRVELLSVSFIPPFLFFPMFPTWQTIYFDYNTSRCEEIIQEWEDSIHRRVGDRLNIVIYLLRADATIRRILDSPNLADIGYVRVSDEELRRPLRNSFESRITQECHHEDDFSSEFFSNTNFHEYICVEIVPPSTP